MPYVNVINSWLRKWLKHWDTVLTNNLQTPTTNVVLTSTNLNKKSTQFITLREHRALKIHVNRKS